MASPAANVARQSINATAILSFGNIISNGILALASLFIARLLTPQGYGIYSLVLALPSLLQYLSGFGVTTAVTRLVSFHLSRGEVHTAQRITKNGVTFLVISGLAFTVVTVILAGFLSSVFLHRSDVTEFVQLASLLIIGQFALNSVNAAFIGWGEPSQVATWTIVQAILKLAMSVGLILLGFGVLGGLDGNSFSLVIAGASGIVFLYTMKLRLEISVNDFESFAPNSFKQFFSDLGQMVRYSLPIYTGNAILTFSQQPIFLLILSAITTNTIIGYYSAASVITAIVVLVGSSLTTALLPAFSRLHGTNSDTRTAFAYAVKYSSYVIMPVTFFLIATSSYIITLLYGSAYLAATYILQLLALSFLPLAFGQAVLPSYFNGIGRTRLTMFMNLVETCATLFPAFVLVILLNLGVNGVLYTIIISNIMPTVFGLYSAKKYLGARIDVANLFRTFLVSVCCYFVLYFISYTVPGSSPAILVLLIELAIYIGLYLTVAPLVHMVKIDDIVRLKTASDDLNILKRFLHPILNYESFVIERLS